MNHQPGCKIELFEQASYQSYLSNAAPCYGLKMLSVLGYQNEASK
jgi:hypothetical protein